MHKNLLLSYSKAIFSLYDQDNFSHTSLFMEIPIPTLSNYVFAPCQVWMVIVMTLVVMGPFIYGMITARVTLCKGDPTLTRTFPVTECVWFVYGALMKQGSTLKPISGECRKNLVLFFRNTDDFELYLYLK